MPDRLPELQRQRALLQDHLAWLDREIAAAQGKLVPMPPAASQPAPAKAPAAPLHSATSEAAAEIIISQYQKDPGSVKTDTKRGCLTIFGYAMGVLALTAFISYWLYARHLGRWW